MVLKDVRPIIAELVRLKKSIPLTRDIGRYLPEVIKNTHGEAVRCGIKKALRLIEQAPVADVVEVVRCKDCIHNGQVTMPIGFEYCVKRDDIVRSDDFCSKGAKMDAKEDAE